MKLIVFTAILGATFVPLAHSQESDWQQRFQSAQSAAQAAEERQDWPDALRRYEEVLKLIPGEITTLASLAKCHLYLNEPDKALDRLAEAVEHGWNQKKALDSDAVFECLRGREWYKRLLGRIDEIEKENIVVHVPPGLDRSMPAPLLLAFHGRGENPHIFLPT